MFEGTVLVLGATGQTGQRVVKALTAKGIKVRALVRNPQKGEGLHAPGVEVRTVSLTNDADLDTAFDGIKAVISALGGTAEARPEDRDFIEHRVFEKLEELGARHHIDQIVLCSSMGTDNPDSIPFLAPVLRLKRLGEQIIENGRIPYTIIRPGGLVNDPGGKEIAVARSHTVGGRISRDDVAEVLVQALLQPEARNKIFEIIQKDGAGKANRAHLFG